MNNPDINNEDSGHQSQNLLITLQFQIENVAGGVKALIESGEITDEGDLGILIKATAFIESPTTNLEEIMRHTTNVGMVIALYQGALPLAINGLNRYLWTLQGINLLDEIETKIEQNLDYTNIPAETKNNAMTCAVTLSKAYNDNSLLDALHYMGM